MTILHLGHQANEIPSIGSLISTNSLGFDSTLDINGLGLDGFGSTTPRPFQIPLRQAPTGDLWFSFRFRTGPTNFNVISNPSAVFFDFRDANNAILARWRPSNTTNAHHAVAVGDTTVEGTSSWIAANNATYWIDVCLKVGANIVFEMYIDGTLISTATAANTGGKGKPVLVNFHNLGVHNNSSGVLHFLAHFAAMDNVSTIGRRFVRRRPNALSSQTAMTGDTAALSDGNIGSRIVSTTGAERRSFTLQGPTGPASPSAIPAVHVKTLAQAGNTGPNKGRAFLRISATNYDGVNTTFPFIKPDFGYDVWTQNPATSSPWTTGTLPTEVGVQSNT